MPPPSYCRSSLRHLVGHSLSAAKFQYAGGLRAPPPAVTTAPPAIPAAAHRCCLNFRQGQVGQASKHLRRTSSSCRFHLVSKQPLPTATASRSSSSAGAVLLSSHQEIRVQRESPVVGPTEGQLRLMSNAPYDPSPIATEQAQRALLRPESYPNSGVDYKVDWLWISWWLTRWLEEIGEVFKFPDHLKGERSKQPKLSASSDQSYMFYQRNQDSIENERISYGHITNLRRDVISYCEL
ncbi:hypothetical protein Droror1_Dr00007817 [Drosera rotundifolia]